MQTLEHRIQGVATLGAMLRDYFLYGKEAPIYAEVEAALEKAEQQNAWFDRENCLFALKHWAGLLKEDTLRTWLSPYTIGEKTPKQIALVLAGNIPMVGFHDLLCALLSGHKALVKLSSNDKVFLPFLVKKLEEIAPEFQGKVQFTEEKLHNFDAVIATGSNNTARYFEYYFGQKPHIIRRNRNSVAVLTGAETPEELFLLGEDIFRYFGLGCRSISKLFVPEDYDFVAFFEAIYPYHTLLDHQKYVNNYDYNKAVYLMSLFQLLENGFLLLKEDEKYASPIATLFYERYKNIPSLLQRLETDKEQIQCIVGGAAIPQSIGFGQSQVPSLADYADGVDTMAFLNSIN